MEAELHPSATILCEKSSSKTASTLRAAMYHSMWVVCASLTKFFAPNPLRRHWSKLRLLSVLASYSANKQVSTSNIYLYTLAVSPSLGDSRQHKENNKTMGVTLHSSSNDEGPSRVRMALLEQHSPTSPVFHNLRRFICHFP